MRWLGAVAAAVFVLVLAGCGGDADEQKAPGADKELESALDKVDEVARSDSARQAGKEEPVTGEEALREYFALVNRREYSKAWGMVSDSVRDQFGGFEAWVDGFATTESSRIVSIEPTGKSGESESFQLEIQAVDEGPCEEALVRGFAGGWTLQPKGNGWVITAAAFDQVSGDGSASCGATAPVYFTDAAYQVLDQPSAIQIDNHDVLTGLSWSGWGSPTTTATGILQHRICDPYCAAGYDVPLSAEATMSGIVSCGGRQQYSSLTISFSGSSPDGISSPATVPSYGAC